MRPMRDNYRGGLELTPSLESLAMSMNANRKRKGDLLPGRYVPRHLRKWPNRPGEYVNVSEYQEWIDPAPSQSESLPRQGELALKPRNTGSQEDFGVGAKRYEGDVCNKCGNFTMIREGTRLICDTCGRTTACS